MRHYTYEEFKAEHPDDAACLAKIMVARYGGTEIDCPGCKKRAKFHPMTKRRAYACQLCGEHVYPCVGTPFAKSRTPLSKWLFAVWLFTTSRHGIAARELERQIGVTHKCAWRMAHEIRKHMAKADRTGPLGGQLEGHIELDDAYVGGRGHKRGRGTDQTPLLGMVERGGRVRVRVMPFLRTGVVRNAVLANVKRGTRISTDELPLYRSLSDYGYRLRAVRHGKKEWVRGDVHTNSIEGYWSRLKLSIRGTHVHVSRRHLWKYTSEFSYRYNMRKQPADMFHHLISSLAGPST